ncbi:hypothetical protein [Labedaea rhizosphaerae]|uniref:Uncharacterized protein n=1 Tax=Labedaea rhizosphaerae TaxID=598644 RepID=A0A4R6SPB6_LABRH|nr:hypothetical protein [Labedaea rhizosphaerae]TDQ05063.1 hypothetical protein EV186_1011027 [Labedaea rhizosphaerae]
MTEPVIPRYRDKPTHAYGIARGALVDAALHNVRQVAAVLVGLAVLFVAGWTGLLLAGAHPVRWGQVLMDATFTVALVMLLEAARRVHLVRAVRRLAGGERWQYAEAHWIGRRGVRGRRLMVLSEDGAACLWVRDMSPATERAIDNRGRVLMLRPALDGRTAVFVDQRATVLLARLTTSAS